MTPWFEDGDRQQGRPDIGGGGDDEDRAPSAGNLLQLVGVGNKQSSRSLCGVEQSRVGGGELGTKSIRGGRGKQAIDLTPGKKYEPAQQHEPERVLPPQIQIIDADAFNPEGDEHRLLPPNLIRDPAEKRSREPIEDSVECGGEGE